MSRSLRGRSAYSPAERGSRRAGTGRATKDFVPSSAMVGEVRRREHAMRPLRPSVRSFQNAVWDYWEKHGRHNLPWRKTKDPYKILVSEVMLQQTQVPRVIEKYKEFLKAFPTVETLARSNLAEVLQIWNGLGYNRRGKYLRDAAIMIVANHHGKVPRDATLLRSLPVSDPIPLPPC